MIVEAPLAVSQWVKLILEIKLQLLQDGSYDDISLLTNFVFSPVNQKQRRKLQDIAIKPSELFQTFCRHACMHELPNALEQYKKSVPNMYNSGYHTRVLQTTTDGFHRAVGKLNKYLWVCITKNVDRSYSK